MLSRKYLITYMYFVGRVLTGRKAVFCRCQQLQNLLPDWIPSKWLTLFSQTWEGDVTMVLPATWTLRQAIVNPSTPELLEATHRGEVATWEKLSAIQVNCAIERALDHHLSQVAAQLRNSQLLKGMKSRIPSWLHMPMLGESASTIGVIILCCCELYCLTLSTIKVLATNREM